MAKENLDLYRNQSLPCGARISDLLQYLEGSSLILKLYLSEFMSHRTGGTEMAQLLGKQLEVAVVMVATIDEYLSTLDDNDPHRATREEGIQQVKHGLANMVAGTIESLTETENYEVHDLKQLATRMADTFPQLLPALPPGAQAETMVRLSGFAEDPEMRFLQPELDLLVERLKTTSTASIKSSSFR